MRTVRQFFACFFLFFTIIEQASAVEKQKFYSEQYEKHRKLFHTVHQDEKEEKFLSFFPFFSILCFVYFSKQKLMLLWRTRKYLCISFYLVLVKDFVRNILCCGIGVLVILGLTLFQINRTCRGLRKLLTCSVLN